MIIEICCFLFHSFFYIFLFIYSLSVCFFFLTLLFWSKRTWTSLWADETIQITCSTERCSWSWLRIGSSWVPFSLWANQDVTPPLQRVQIEVGAGPRPLSPSCLETWQTSMLNLPSSSLSFVLFAVFDAFIWGRVLSRVNPQLWGTWLGSH